jgi:hypothetical protein
VGSREFPEKGDKLEHCLDASSRRFEADPKSNRARNQDTETSYHMSRIGKEDPANLFERSWPSKERRQQRPPKSKPPLVSRRNQGG